MRKSGRAETRQKVFTVPSGTAHVVDQNGIFLGQALLGTQNCKGIRGLMGRKESRQEGGTRLDQKGGHVNYERTANERPWDGRNLRQIRQLFLGAKETSKCIKEASFCTLEEHPRRRLKKIVAQGRDGIVRISKKTAPFLKIASNILGEGNSGNRSVIKTTEKENGKKRGEIEKKKEKKRIS